MSKWEDFENDMVEYLEDELEEYDVHINQYGSADSTISDIEIELNKTGDKFYIETKMPNSQSSQFVVDIVNGEFVYGSKNRFKSNVFSDEIIEYLNDNFEYYKNVNQSSLSVDVPLHIAYGFIVSNMKNKNVKFVMSVDDNGNKKIIPIDEFDEFFDVKTVLRKKKSGSSSISKLYYDDFKLQLDKRFSNNKYSLFVKDNRLYLELSLDLQKNECYIDSDMLDGKRYYLSKKDNYIYEVKITSSTNNPNIIFELSTKNVDNDSFTIQCLIDYLDSINV